MFLDVRDGLLYGCTAHRLSAGPAPVPVPTSVIRLLASVGSGGKNIRSDVFTIQGALNGIDPSDGGADPRLAIDGICGPLTTRAIGTFQRRARVPRVDLRIDPDGPTLAALNTRLSASPVLQKLALSLQEAHAPANNVAAGVTNEVQMVLNHVPTIRGAVFLARNRIESVKPFVTASGLVTPAGSGSERDRFNLELMDEVFRLSDFVNPLGVYQRLRFQFEGMVQAIRICDPAQGVEQNGLFLKNQSALMEPAAAAYVTRSGKFVDEPTAVTEDNVVISTKRIYITGFIKRIQASRRDIIDLIAHELAHFCSPPGFSVVDRFRGHTPIEQERFRTGVYDRIANAENYGWFTWRSFEGKFAF
jgi:hypothetical protein